VLVAEASVLASALASTTHRRRRSSATLVSEVGSDVPNVGDVLTWEVVSNNSNSPDKLLNDEGLIGGLPGNDLPVDCAHSSGDDDRSQHVDVLSAAEALYTLGVSSDRKYTGPSQFGDELLTESGDADHDLRRKSDGSRWQRGLTSCSVMEADGGNAGMAATENRLLVNVAERSGHRSVTDSSSFRYGAWTPIGLVLLLGVMYYMLTTMRNVAVAASAEVKVLQLQCTN